MTADGDLLLDGSYNQQPLASTPRETTVIRTPEGLDLELQLAGLGSRFGAALVDFLIQTVMMIAAFIAFGVTGAMSNGDLGLLFWGFASLTVTLILLGYPILFETLNNGQSPGKRIFNLRVLGPDGQPVTFWRSTTRNIARVVDFLPANYLVGLVAILVSGENRRVGDLMADTLVCVDRTTVERPSLPPMATAPGWDATAVTAEEVQAIRAFLERRPQLHFDRRRDLAARLAARIRNKIPESSSYQDEAVLELVLAEKLSRDF